jgi:hypothetical protein
MKIGILRMTFIGVCVYGFWAIRVKFGFWLQTAPHLLLILNKKKKWCRGSFLVLDQICVLGQATAFFQIGLCK